MSYTEPNRPVDIEPGTYRAEHCTTDLSLTPTVTTCNATEEDGSIAVAQMLALSCLDCPVMYVETLPNAGGGQTSTSLELYDLNGSISNFSNAKHRHGHQQLLVNPRSSATYYLRVEGGAIGFDDGNGQREEYFPVGPYSIRLSETPAGELVSPGEPDDPDGFEPDTGAIVDGQFSGEATPLVVDEIQDHTLSAGDEDWFAIRP